MPYLYLLIAFSLNATANILLKIGAQKGFVFEFSNFIPSLVRNWHVELGAILFILNAGFYFLALRSFPISIAYPIMVGMSFALINAYAFFGLHESISWLQILGYLLLFAGLICIIARTPVTP